MRDKQSLSEMVFDSLDAMMLAYADEAVVLAARQGERLDYSGQSVAAVERCLAKIAAPFDDGTAARPDLEYDSRVWGAYLGQVVRRHYGGEWQMSPYPGAQEAGGAEQAGAALAVLSLEVRRSHLYPMMKVLRRLTLGPDENVLVFYGMVTKRLGPPSSVQ